MRSRLPEIKGNWVFESSADGSILYYPRGWGRAYLVPSEEKKREIESFLSAWLARRRAIFWFIRRTCLPAMAPMLVALIILWIPSLRNSAPAIPLFIAFALGPSLAVIGCALILISDLVLRFVAELAKADLEPVATKLPLQVRLKVNTLSYSWNRFGKLAFCYGITFIFSLLWLIREEWNHVPFPLLFSFIWADLMIFGIAGSALGLAVLAWQAKVKLYASA